MRVLLWIGLPLVLVQGCAGSPVGEQLERSFDTPPTLVPDGATAVTTPRRPAPEPDVAAQKPEQAEVKPVVKEASQPAESKAVDLPAEPAAADADKAVQPESAEPSGQKPQPYRITIRLAGVDPAAPAEAVTRALRGSDVRFAVERIERIEAETTPEASPSPASAP